MLLAQTRDDAVGEAFDKGASLLGLPYPGGPVLAQLAAGGDQSTFPFPLPLQNHDTLDFSFSGLKTALRYTIRDVGDEWELHKKDLAASYEHALCAHLIDRVLRCMNEHPEIQEVHIVGGVSANRHLRELLGEICTQHHLILRVPKKLEYCTDNAAMIASAGYCMLQERQEEACTTFTTEAHIPLKDFLVPKNLSRKRREQSTHQNSESPKQGNSTNDCTFCFGGHHRIRG